MLVALGLLLPLVWLLIRATGASEATLASLTRAATWATLGRSVLLAVSVTGVAGAVAVPLAWLTTRTDLPLRRLWAVLTPLPLVMPSFVGAYLYVSALGPRGLLVTALLEPVLGVERLPSFYGFPGALFVMTLMTYPYLLLSVRAALSQLDPALEEAARSLGHSPWQVFWRVTLPHLRPALGAGGLLVALYTLRDFGAVSTLRYTTFTRAIYVQFNAFDREGASALALLLVALTLVFVWIEARTRGRARYYAAGTVGGVRHARRVRLGVWRWPALLFVASVVFLGLVLPLALLGYWLVRGLLAGEVIGTLWAATGNALLGSGIAALAVMAAALPVVLLVVRYPGRGTRLLERLAFSVYALPGVVVALALVFFGIHVARPLYQSLAMLVFAYVILFFPQAVGAVRASLLQVHPSLEESGRSLGHHPLTVLRRVTLPLVSPGVLSGAALVFLTAMKELPATLLLAPTGYRTLATEIWSAVSEAFFAQAAAPALLLVLLSSLPMALLLARDWGDAR